MEFKSKKTKYDTNFPGFTDEAHPEVFNLQAMPPQPGVLKPGQLPAETIKQFFEKGFLIVPDFFKEDELNACRKDIEILVENTAERLYKAGKVKDLYKDKGLFERLTFLENDFPGANILMHKEGLLAKSFENSWCNERLLNLVEQLIGPEILGHPVWNLRAKTPQTDAATVPWHQDAAYLENDSYFVMRPTAWIPLLDATKENGCMEVVSGGHRTGRIARHTNCWRDTWYIELSDEDMEETLDVDLKKDKVLCPVPYKGLLIFNNLVPHRSLNNVSNEIRWSLDLRWQAPDKPIGVYKPGVLMRSQKTPVDKIDWDSFNAINWHKKEDSEIKEEDQFDTTVVGPWMEKWEITHPNRHTARLAEQKVPWHKA